MFSELNPLGRDTAILEILIMLLGAFLIGFFTAWLIQQARRKKGGGGKENNAKAIIAAARSKNKELKEKLDKLRKDIQDLEARKTAAEKTAGNLAEEVKKLKGKPSLVKPAGNNTPPSGWQKEKSALEEKIKGLEKTVSDNRSEIGRAASFRNEIKDLKRQLAEAKKEVSSLKAVSPKENTSSAKGTPSNQSTPTEQPDSEKLNREVIRMRALLATQEAAVRRAEHRARQLEKENENATKERDSALEQLDDLQFKMDKLQRQVEKMRVSTSKMDQSQSAVSRQSGGAADLVPLTTLKGLGNRSAEFLEKLGINTMERLAETDENTIKYISRTLDKPIEAVQKWVELAKEKA